MTTSTINSAANATANAATPVVSHDTPAISPLMAAALTAANKGVNEAIFTLERLETERETWETKELAASRNRLYSLLTDCYSYYLSMKTDNRAAVREQFKKGLETFITVRKYTFTPTSHDINKIVKSVFGVERRRVSAYSLALRAALAGGAKDAQGKQQPVPAADLAAWLEQQGGVEEVRMGSKNAGMTVKERADVAKTALQSAVLMTLKADAKVMPFDTDDVDKMMVLVATYRPNGELDISAVVKNDTAVRAALAAYYSGNKEGVQQAADKAANEPAPESAITLALAQTAAVQ